MNIRVLFKDWGSSPWRNNISKIRQDRGIVSLVMPGTVENYKASEVLCLVKRP